MAVDVLCSRIYESIADIKQQAEHLGALREDARKLHRYIKRVEAVVSDLQPYYIQQQISDATANSGDTHSNTDTERDTDGVSTAAQVLAGLHEVQAVLSEVQEALGAAGSKGKLSVFLQADLLLQQFQSAIADLDSAVAHLPCSPVLGAAHQETAENIESLRAALRTVRFELPGQQAQQLQEYRSACDSSIGPLERLEASGKNILQQAYGHSTLAWDEFAAAIADLQREVTQMQQQQPQQQSQQGLQPSHSSVSSGSVNSDGQTDTMPLQQQPFSHPAVAPAAAAVTGEIKHLQQQEGSIDLHLRMMCDLLCVQHQQEGVPLEFTCPITMTVMRDPVIIHETGHSYERQAIEDWFASGHRLCPKSGKTLGRKLNTSPNHALRAAITTWTEANNLGTKWRPVLRGHVAGSKDLPRESINQHSPVDDRRMSGYLGTKWRRSSSHHDISPTSSTSTDLDAIEGTISAPPAATGVTAVTCGGATSESAGSSTSTDVDAIEGTNSRGTGPTCSAGNLVIVGDVVDRGYQQEPEQLALPMSAFTLSDTSDSTRSNRAAVAAVKHIEGRVASRTAGDPALPLSK